MLTGLEHSLVGILLLLGYMAATGPISVRQSAFFSQPLCRATWERSSLTWISGCWVSAAIATPSSTGSISFFVLVLLVRRQARFLHILVAGYGVGLASHLWWDIIDYGNVRWLPGGLLTGCGSASMGCSAS